MNELSSTIDTYLEAYGETDAERRAQLIEQVWTKDGRLVDPPLDAEGHEGISGMAAAVQSQFPGHRFRRTSGVDAHHDVARYGWDLVSADGAVVLSGMDVAELDGDRIRRVTGFFGDLPTKDA
jgi:hypothetical protein